MIGMFICALGSAHVLCSRRNELVACACAQEELFRTPIIHFLAKNSIPPFVLSSSTYVFETCTSVSQVLETWNWYTHASVSPGKVVRFPSCHLWLS